MKVPDLSFSSAVMLEDYGLNLENSFSPSPLPKLWVIIISVDVS